MQSPRQPLPSGGDRLGHTADGLGGPGRDELWRHIRGLRCAPPGLAGAAPDRHKVFGAALEQAEELFKAATNVAAPSRPILLFYGLSQAGRAIAAASTAATTDWELQTHGITTEDLKIPSLSQLVIKDQASRLGSFTRLAALLSSGSLQSKATFGEIWATIPDLAQVPLAWGTAGYKGALRWTESYYEPAGDYGAWIGGLPRRFVRPYMESDIVDYLSSYPTLAGNGPAGPDRGPTQWIESSQSAAIPRTWPATPDGYDAFRRHRTTAYRGDNDQWIFPVIGTNTSPLHPLLAWWAILFALSMLARYAPGAWTTHLDIDASADAMPLETVLDLAFTTCPELILHTIRAVSR